MRQSIRKACLSLFACCFVAAVSSLRGDEPRRHVEVEVAPGGGHVETGINDASTDGNVVRGKDLMGLKVYGLREEKLGNIEDLVIDPSKGSIRYAVLSFGGFLGMGDKYFAVPWSDLQFVSKGSTTAGTTKESYCLLEINKEDLKNAPGFDKNSWPNFADRHWSTDVDKYYKEHRQTRKPGDTMR